MRVLQPDRVVRALTAITSFAYYFIWVCGVLVLIAVPAAKLDGGTFSFNLPLPVAVPNLQATVQTTWGDMPLALDEAQGKLQLPLSKLPWRLVALLWIYTAAVFVLTLLFLQNLRRIFQRVRDGAAFDAQNARRLRTLSVLLLALAMLDAVAENAAAIAARSGLVTGSALTVPAGFRINGTLVVVALVFVALAEVFRRGAELEDEQSLVV